MEEITIFDTSKIQKRKELAGIFVYIPFCRSACSYCNFHFTTSLKNKTSLLKAMVREIEMKKNYLKTNNFQSIYFGGGTPSLLTIKEIDLLMNKIHANFHLEKNAEITLEANPDDLNPEYLSDLITIGINRLSIGIQSFFADDLRWLGRSHSDKQAEICIKHAQKTGFINLSIDLIYGIPGSAHFAGNLEKIKIFDIPHFSAYSLTLEPKTIYAWQVMKKRKKSPSDEDMIKDFQLLCSFADFNGYQHYEISNFCKPGFKAIHNSAYWFNEPYIGIGPSAHSYNLSSRQWNFRVNSEYINAVESGNIYYEKEILTEKDQLNEYLMTRLRTSEGIDLQYILNKLTQNQQNEMLSLLKHFSKQNLMVENNGKFALTRQGMLMADKIISELFLI